MGDKTTWMALNRVGNIARMASFSIVLTSSHEGEAGSQETAEPLSLLPMPFTFP